MNDTQYCPRCHRTKLVSDFNFRNSKSGVRQGWCRECHNMEMRERNWRKQGIDMDLVRYSEALVYRGGACDICSVVTESLELHVDHKHGESRVRGFLCGECNKGLGMFYDDPEKLRRAADYLDRHNRLPPESK